jgi:hypothetical protein
MNRSSSQNRKPNVSVFLRRIGWPIALAIMFAAPLGLDLAAVGQAAEPASDKLPEKTEDDNGNLTYRLAVSPAAEPQPALRYRFLVPPVDQVHANAATFYYKAMVTDPGDWITGSEAVDQMHAWVELPIGELPIAEVKKKVDQFDNNNALAALRGAATADYCNWEDPIRQYGIATPLPQAQKLRSLARIIALAARIQIAEHRHQDAIDTLRLGYALSRHAGQGPSLVQSLIGMAVGGYLNDQTQALIADPDSPNLYWALTELASQPVELRRGFSYENNFWELTIHDLPDLGRRVLSPRESLDLAKKIYEFGSLDGWHSRTPWSLGHEFAALSAALAIEPQARQYLIEHGFAAAQLDAMPILQRALLYRWQQHVEVRDNFFKWSLLPDDENSQRKAGFEAEERLAGWSDFGEPFSKALPPLLNMYNARRWHLRQVNMLRTIEALRMHAARQGAWPQSLAAVTAVPIPENPMTQKPFEYSVAGRVATLSAPRSGHPVTYPSVRYELTLRKSTTNE